LIHHQHFAAQAAVVPAISVWSKRVADTTPGYVTSIVGTK